MARGFESPTQVWCTAWTEAWHVSAVEHEEYGRVPRVRLDEDERWWPTPPGQKLGHFGVLDAETVLDPPKGWRWCSPRFSKRGP